MIGYLQGKVVYSDGKKTILLTANGTGYEVNYAKYASPDSEASLYVHHHISENDQSLWGFDELEEKKMFELLKSVNKVGSSKAYPLVTQIGVKDLIAAIVYEQVEVLTKAPGIGKKMAEQIILSLKDKVERLESFKAGELATPEQKGEQAEMAISAELYKEALQALESLGYKEKQVASALNSKMGDSIKTSEDLIKLVLRDL